MANNKVNVFFGYLMMMLVVACVIGFQAVMMGPTCIQNGGNCQPDGSLGACCSGYCRKQAGWAMGDCEEVVPKIVLPVRIYGKCSKDPFFGSCGPHQNSFSQNVTQEKVMFDYMAAAMGPLFAVPCIIICCVYLAIWICIRFCGRTNSVGSCAELKARSRGSLMMFAVFIFYVVCVMPTPMANSAGGNSHETLGNWPLWIVYALMWSYGCNFFFYVALNSEFRKAFQSWWKVPKRKSTHGTLRRPTEIPTSHQFAAASSETGQQRPNSRNSQKLAANQLNLQVLGIPETSTAHAAAMAEPVVT